MYHGLDLGWLVGHRRVVLLLKFSPCDFVGSRPLECVS